MARFDSLTPHERLILVSRFIAEAASVAEPPQSSYWGHMKWTLHVTSNLRLALHELEVLARTDKRLDYKGAIETAKQQIYTLWPKGD